jgi:purine-binding chemotaxis protein CheW
MDMNIPDDTMQFLSFRLGDEEYGIDILAVREVRPLQKLGAMPGAAPAIRGSIELRGVRIPVVDLRVRFRLPAAPHACGSILVIQAEGRTLGLLVDSVREVLRVPARDLHPAPMLYGRTPGFMIQALAAFGERFVILLRTDKLVHEGRLAA